MIYFIIWVVILLGCVIALPVASMMEKRKVPSSPAYDQGEMGQEEYENFEDAAPEMADDGFGDQGFEGDAMPEMEQPVGGDDFSAFEEEFN